MRRECREEADLDIGHSRWLRVGRLISADRTSWLVDVFTAKLQDEPQIEIFIKRYIEPPEVDKAVLVPVRELYELEMAPHAGAFIHASLQMLKYPSTAPIITISEEIRF